MLTAQDLVENLRSHYIRPGGGWAGGIFLPEVGVNGGEHSRRVDALYVGLSAASGRHLVGHEIKISRADWQHELASAGKADPWHDACHSWYVVAPDTTIVDPDTLPAGWGLMIPKAGGRMKIVVKAAERDHEPPWWATRSIMNRMDVLHTQKLKEVHDDATRTVNDRVEKLRAAATTAIIPESAKHAEQVVKAFSDHGIVLDEHSTHIYALQDRGEIRVGPEDVAVALKLVAQHAANRSLEDGLRLAADELTRRTSSAIERHARDIAHAAVEIKLRTRKTGA